jgi:phage baseplate assembly protein W
VDGGFLGRGWAFPLAVSPDDVAMVAAEEDIRQAIRLILETAPGERVMRPTFGSGLRAMTFAPINVGTLSRVQHRVEEALVQWEPRIDVVEVTVSAAEARTGLLHVDIRYRVRATNTFYNLVYPFYLREGRS